MLISSNGLRFTTQGAYNVCSWLWGLSRTPNEGLISVSSRSVAIRMLDEVNIGSIW